MILVYGVSGATALKLLCSMIEPESIDGATLQELVVGSSTLKSASLAEARTSPCA
ncbi:hypothetical protein PF011_g26406 [Phytophthora fragariae]|uniref:Uncharacterized protein n=1 Tax=Phytophthora fragariae TaxID=53985 RepID=A0A6A3HLC8_9STRA|nr:hypothetical protein PF011_g26406 [Phytophthora fragariae]